MCDNKWAGLCSLWISRDNERLRFALPPDAFGALLELLNDTNVQGQTCSYRGHISPPLEGRWHRGGWTSHFEWRTEPKVTTLDVFGRAVRQTIPWEHELSGLYAGMNVVAEMKRTNRDKDWPFITSLGTEMLRQRDPRGWLHLFDADEFRDLREEYPVPEHIMAARPLLRLALEGDAKLGTALFAERTFWQELDRIRIKIYRAALRPFVLVMGRTGQAPEAGLADQHRARVKCAETNLKPKPIAEYGVERMIEEARTSTAALVNPEGMEWLPNVRSYFKYLES